MSKVFDTRKFRVNFRWKYAFSAFLVCGVLSITIGKNAPDPLLVHIDALAQDFDTAFKINKDPKTATSAEIDGPAERTFPLDSPVLTSLVRRLMEYGDFLSKQSFERAKLKFSDPKLIATASAAQKYSDLRIRVYKNYMRLAHDAQFKTYRAQSLLARSYFVDLLDRQIYGSVGAEVIQRERWMRLNRDALMVPGARAFSPIFYDFLNVRIDPKTAQFLYADKNYKQTFNIRSVKDDSGHFTQVELYMNSFDKQMAEYEAIANPKSKEEYLKLLQFAAIREAMTNRRAIRRMVSTNFVETRRYTQALADNTRYVVKYRNLPMNGATYDDSRQSTSKTGYTSPIALSDASLNSCAPDLVSFRSPKPGKFNVNDLEAYSSLWQEDRHNDLMELGAAAAAFATENVPLLSDAEYAEAFGEYVSAYKGFQTEFMSKYGDDTDALLAAIRVGYAPTIKTYEETKWSSDRLEKAKGDESKLPPSLEKFYLSNLPSDDLSIPAVAERFADQAFLMRLYFLAEGLHYAAKIDKVELAKEEDFFGMYEEGSGKMVQFFPETNLPASKVRAAATAKAFMERVPKGGKEPRWVTWKRTVAARVEKALNEKLGMSVTTSNGNSAGTGFLRGKDEERYAAYAKDLMPVAAVGARGVQVRNAAEKATKELHMTMIRTQECYTPPVQYAQTTCRLRYPDPRKMSKKEIDDANSYIGYAPFRFSARDAGMKDIILPETPDQLSQFFKKKLQVVLSFDNKKTEYGELAITKKIMANDVVMRGMDRFFGTLAGEVDSRSGAGGAAEKPNCAPVLAGVPKNIPKKKVRKPASWGLGAPSKSALTPEQCSSPENDEAEGRRKILEESLVPAAKKAYEEFKAGLSTPGAYKDPERAKKAIEERKNQKPFDFISKSSDWQRPVQDNTAMRNINPRIADLQSQELARQKNEEAKKKAEGERAEVESRRLKGYFRPGPDRSFDMTGGELFLKDEKERKEAILLFEESLAILGLYKDVTGREWARAANVQNYLPTTMKSWISNEWVRRGKFANVRPLERIVGTISDQMAMGQVLSQEAIARGPILTLQDAWDWKKDEKQSPILVERLATAWSPDKAWGDGSGYVHQFHNVLTSAARNDVGKVEKFCQADIKSYRTDDNFRKMFMAISGIRDVLGTNEEMRGWDASVLKESRSWHEQVREDYIDPYSVPLMIAIGIVVVIQVIATIVTGGGALALTGNFFVGVARFIFLQMTGNFGIVTLIFSFQTYLMVSTYHFAMPPQMTFSFQVANSRIQNMETGRFAGASMADREKLSTLREELNSMRFFTNIAIVGEIAQFAGFSIPGMMRTFGLTGSKKIMRLGSASSPAVVAAVKTESLAKLVREKGFVAGVKEYWKEAGPALRDMRRMNKVKSTKTFAEGTAVIKALHEMLSDKISSFFKSKDEVRKFYTVLREMKVKEAKLLFGQSDELYLKSLTKQMEAKPIDMVAIKAQVDEATKELRAKLVAQAKTGKLTDFDEEIIIVTSKRWEDELITEAGKQVPMGSSRAEAKAATLATKGHAFHKEVARIDEILAGLDEAVESPGRSDLQNFFKNHLTISDLEKHKKYFKENRSSLPEGVRKQIRQAYKDLDYLQEDWSKVTPDAKAIGQFFRTGKVHLYIDENGVVGAYDPKEYAKNPAKYGGVGARWDPDEYIKNPEKFSVGSLPIVRFYPELMKLREDTKRAVENVKKNLGQ